MQFNNWLNPAFKIARLLLDPAGGDIVFVVRGTDNSLKRLYAYKSILTGNSEYFAACNYGQLLKLFLQVSFDARMENFRAVPETLKDHSRC